MGRQIDPGSSASSTASPACARAKAARRGHGHRAVPLLGIGAWPPEQRTGAFWGRLGRMRDEHPNLLRLIDWRNLTQVTRLDGPRYGPIYNAGGARSLYAPWSITATSRASGAPVVLIGYSGAPRCASARRPYQPALDAPLTVVSLGAVGSDRGLESVDRMYHLYGSGDVEQKLPAVLLPSRWSLARRSRWNRASPAAACGTSPWAT